MVQETNILPLYLKFFCKLVNVSKILKIKLFPPKLYFVHNEWFVGSPLVYTGLDGL